MLPDAREDRLFRPKGRLWLKTDTSGHVWTGGVCPGETLYSVCKVPARCYGPAEAGP